MGCCWGVGRNRGRMLANPPYSCARLLALQHAAVHVTTCCGSATKVCGCMQLCLLLWGSGPTARRRLLQACSWRRSCAPHRSPGPPDSCCQSQLVQARVAVEWGTCMLWPAATVSPLSCRGPIMAMSLAMNLQRWKLAWLGAWNFLISMAIAVGIGFLVWCLFVSVACLHSQAH